MSILIALVLAGIILVMLASVNDARRTVGPVVPTSAPTVVSPLEPGAEVSVPAAQSASQPAASTQGITIQGAGSDGEIPCVNGCLLDNMCNGAESIIARYDPNNATRYFYTPDQPGYQEFRAAETLGETNFYFCTVAQAQAQGWSRAP